MLLNFIFTVNIVTIPQLVLEKVCLEKYNSTICKQLTSSRYQHEQDTVQQTSSMWVLILLLATLLPSMFTVLVWGPIADKIGRNRAILIPPIFFGLQSIVYLLNSTKFFSSPPAYLLIGAITTSIFGDFQGAYAIAYSYMADITEKSSKRTMRMAIIEGIMFFSGAPAGLASGFLLQNYGFGPVFISTLSMSALMFVNVAFFLPNPKTVLRSDVSDYSTPESVASSERSEDNSNGSENNEEEEMPIICKGRQRKTQETPNIAYHLNPLNHIYTVFSVIKKRKSKGLLIALLAAFWIVIIALAGEIFITVLFIKHRPFNLSPEEVGYYLAFTSITRGIGAVLLSQVAVRCFKLTDHKLIIIGLLSQTTNYILLALSISKTMLYIVTLSGIGIGVATSSLRSLITKQVPSDSHGSILAAIEFLDAFGALLGNVMSNSIYRGTVAIFSGSAFIILGIFSAVALCIASCVQFSLTRRSRESID